MTEEVKQDTQINPEVEVITNATDDSGANAIPTEGQETPANNEGLVSETETLKQKLNEALQQKAVIEARYQEINRISSHNSMTSETAKIPSLRDQIKAKAKSMSDMIIENPEGASDVLTDTLMGLVDSIKTETVNQAKFQNNIENTLTQIKRDNPHLAQFESNIHQKAVELLNNGQAKDLSEALNKSANIINDAFEGYAKLKGATIKPVFHDTSQIGKGNMGAISNTKKIVSEAPTKVLTEAEEIQNRINKGLKRRI